MRHTGVKIIKSKIFLILFAAFLLYTLAGFFIAPVAIRWYVPRYTQKNYHCRSSLAKVRVNPFLLTVEAKGFSLDPPQGPSLVSFKKMFVSLKLSSLLHLRAIIQKLSLDKPAVHLAIEPDGTLNIERLAGTRKSSSSSFPLVLRNLLIQGGEITIVDKRQSEPFTTDIETLNISAKNLSTLKDSEGTYSLSAAIRNGGTIHVEGKVSLSPLRSSGKLDLSEIRAKTLWGFLRNRFNLAPPEGRFGLTTSYRLDAAKTPVQMTMNGINAYLSNLSLKLTNTGKPFLELKKANLIASHLDAAKKDLHIEKLLVDGGRVDVKVDKSGRLNLRQIVRQARAQPIELKPGQKHPESVTGGKRAAMQPAAAQSQVQLKADSIEIKNVAIAYNDESGPTPVRAGISSLHLKLKAELKAGRKQKKTGLSAITAHMKKVEVGAGRPPASLFSVDDLAVEGADCNFSDHSIVLSRIVLNKGHLDLTRDKEGRIELLQQFGGQAKKNGASRLSKGSPSNWKLLVKSLEVQGFASRLSDLTKSQNPLYTLQNIDAKATDIGGKSPVSFTAAFSVKQGGKVNIQGKVDPSAHSANAKLNVRDLVLTPLQPYLEPSVNLVMRSAEFSSQGTFDYATAGKKVKAAYDGSLGLNKFAFSKPNSNRTYLGWDSLEIPGLRLTLQPNVLEIPGMTITKPVGRLIIEPNRTLNLARIFKSQPGRKKTKPGMANFRFLVSRIKVEDGNLFFVDSSIRPNFRVFIHGLKGTVAGLSSVKTSASKINLQGVVNRYGFVKINGVLRPYEIKRLADILMVFQNIEMTSLSPYSGKFAGRMIKSGRLSANLKYRIENARMIGNNRIIADNLRLGKRVKSRSAVDLPLDLAIDLLQGPNGRIDIALPVAGNLNDPEFSFGPLIWEAFKALIRKTVAAPFRAIGALFGGKSKAPDLVEFDAGSTEILPPEKEKLKKLAEAMQMRPGLKLVIQGLYSPDADGEELREFSVRRAVVTRLGIRLSPGENPGPIVFADPETQSILEKLYAARFGKAALDKLERGVKEGKIKPRISHQERLEKAAQKKESLLSKMTTDLRLYKIIPGVKSPKQAVACAAEEYRRLVDSEKIPDEALLRIADERARAVAKELETTDGVPSDRLAIEKANLQSSAAKPAAKLSLGALSS